MGASQNFNSRDNERLEIKTLQKSFFLNSDQRDQFLVNIERNAQDAFGANSSEYLICFLEIAEKKRVSSVDDLVIADLMILATTDSTWVNGMTPEIFFSQSH